MAAKTSAFARLKALAKEIPDEPRIRGLLRLIENRHLGSDYAVAIIGASLVERALEAAIVARFVPLDKDQRSRLFNYERRGPLAELGTRNLFGAALGLYGQKTFQDLEKIRHVRNVFAHSPSLRGFNSEEIAQACTEFNVVNFVFRHVPADGSPKEPPKTLYVSACLAIAGRLRVRLESPAQETTPIVFPMADKFLP
jgi:hypothetical protein